MLYEKDLTDKIIGAALEVHRIAPIHTAQLMTYLRRMGCQVGLLMNFNVEKLRDGIVRRVI